MKVGRQNGDNDYFVLKNLTVRTKRYLSTHASQSDMEY